MLIDHIFRNIDEAWDYILCEEESRLIRNGWGTPPSIVRCSDCDFSRPITEEEAAKMLIGPDNLDYGMSAYYNNADMSKFVMTRLRSGRFSLKPNLRSRKFLFRGERKLRNVCEPTVFRDHTAKGNDRYIEEMMRGQELMLLMLSHPLVQLLDMGVELGGRHIRFEMNLYGLTQHYYNKTTFLDLTSSPDVASFFATNKNNNGVYEPVGEGEGVIYLYELNGNDCNDPSKKWTLSTIGLQVFPRSGNQRGFLCAMPEKLNFNDIEPVTIVRFKHDLEKSRYYYDLFDGGRKLFPDDILTRHWLSFNDKQKIISTRTVEMNSMFNYGRPVSELRSKIEAKGYEVKDYKVEFTPEELAEYYDDVRLRHFWRDLCDCIFIPSDRDGRMKRDLLAVEHNPAYEWAFKPVIAHTLDYNQGFLLKKYQRLLKD